jgi:hypothetical protein
MSPRMEPLNDKFFTLAGIARGRRRARRRSGPRVLRTGREDNALSLKRRYNRHVRVVPVLIAAAALLMVPAADAKVLTKIVAIGAGGSYVELRGLDWSSLRTAPVETAPSEVFVLFYPLMERGLPAEPGRLFPNSGVACFSWDRTVSGSCWRVADGLAAQLGSLAPVVGEPTVLRSLVVRGSPVRVESNGAVAIELAFNRPQLARPAPKRPVNCVTLRARWVGHEAAARPARFWSCPGGLWSRGKIYPLAKGALAYL